MTVIEVPYGKGHLSAELEGVEIRYLEPENPPGVDPTTEVSRALDQPISHKGLGELRGSEIAVVVSDQTRPIPSRSILEVLISRLREHGVDESHITVIVGGGLHRQTGTLEEILGADILSRVGNAVIHDARKEEELVFLGLTSRGTPIWINKHFVQAEKRIVTGMIDPHHFMGYTGGAKGAAIGVGGMKTIEANHSLLMAEGSKLGAMEGNPTREDVDEMGNKLNIDLLVNAVLNLSKQTAKVVAGHWLHAHREGVDFVRKMVEVKTPYLADVVVASPGGSPKDINLYQAQKALTTAEMVCKPNGVIILVAECPHRLGDEVFEETMSKFISHQEIIDHFQSLPFRMGIHKAYMWSRQLNTKQVILVSHKMDPSDLKNLKVEHANDLTTAIHKAREMTSLKRALVLPLASSTVPI